VAWWPIPCQTGVQLVTVLCDNASLAQLRQATKDSRMMPTHLCCRFIVALLVTVCAACAKPQAVTANSRPKNLILMIGDGMGFAQVKAYRYYADAPATPVIEPLPFDRYLVGAVATDSISLDCGATDASPCVRDPAGITDSASSATAYATGQDTLVGRVSLSPDDEIQPTISEKARRQGKSVGLAVTSQLTHATPAAFAAHVKTRSQYHDIADQLFDNQWNGEPLAQVLLGGGMADMQRQDRDLVAEFTRAGYDFVTNREELLNTGAQLILGLFARWGLPRSWDRDDSVPSLADMTAAAIKALSKDPDGFFLMVEGSQIDWAAHADDVSGVISEVEDFTAAARVALDFALSSGDTLVIITADHETGGMSLGRDDLYRWNPRPLRGMKQTPAAITEEFLRGDEPLSEVAARSLPFTLTGEEQVQLDSWPREPLLDSAYGVDGMQAYIGLNQIMDLRTLTGWSTLAHTGVDVPLYAVGPGSENFHGVMQNEEVGEQMQAVFLP